ncbi:MAG TPA: arginine--tRNA ligase [Williamwhitmania sp.]|nr:arginine--tRNA ligase [Williamwhitmania sp.]
MNLESYFFEKVAEAIKVLYGSVDEKMVQLQKTRKEFKGDITLVTFPLLKLSKKSPEQTAQQLGEYLSTNVNEVAEFNVVKGFLNISLASSFWIEQLNEVASVSEFGNASSSGKTTMVEYSSPNTNKPLHLGHIRNNLLGASVSKLLKAAGNKVIQVNLVNDRGIHICKSMVAWKRFGMGETPLTHGKKGDHLVGDYYVAFDKAYKAEVQDLIASGRSKEDAEKLAPLMLEAQDMLRKWEASDADTINLWKTMNGWVYEGFAKTYSDLGISFDNTYYESQTYLQGKAIVQTGLEKGVFYKKEDGSVWVDLTADGLDEKLLLRADGTSVYMTQDLGTAVQRFTEEKLDEHIYVVGNEQNYHFQVLKLVLQKLGYEWAQNIFHLSYGMVELPEGKMKSREGTVVDADDLVEEMVSTARDMSQELGKLDGRTPEEAMQVARMVGLGALKYFILRVDPRKSMTFDPRESIDFNGNTGPFIQYTHARIKSVLRKAEEQNINFAACKDLNLLVAEKEISLIKLVNEFPSTVAAAAADLSPAVVANYCYDISKEYNQFYHELSVLKEENVDIRNMRLLLSAQVAKVIASGMNLLGIEVPERM